MRRYLMVIGIIAIVCNNAFATGDKTITSQKYVENQLATKQGTIPAIDTNTVITHTGESGEIGQKAIYDSNENYAGQQSALMTAGDANTGINNALENEFVCIEEDTDHTCLIWQINNNPQPSSTQNPNKFPPPSNQTQSKYGVTITVKDGVYSFSGTATADTYFDFELIKPYTIKKSLNHGGLGVMYFWNTRAFASGTHLYYDMHFLDAQKNIIDDWNFSEINRINSTYVTQTDKVAKYVRLYVYNGEDMDNLSVAPMFVEDGSLNYAHFYPYIMDSYLPNGN